MAQRLPRLPRRRPERHPVRAQLDGFDFDTEIIIQLREAQKRIVEVPIPTYYGDEICHVNGLAYARDVVSDVTRYRLHKLGFGTGELAFASEAYELKDDAGSSHRALLAWLAEQAPGRVLDLGLLRRRSRPRPGGSATT